MSWRIRKSIKVAPGTRINISGSGVSATTRLGKTGISHRTQLVGGRKSSGSSTRATGGSGKKRGCLPVLLLAAVLFFLAAVVYVLWEKFLTLPVAVRAAVAAVVAALCVAAVVLLLRKRRSNETASWTFVLGGNRSAEKQEELKALKIRLESDGIHDTLTLEDNGGSLSVKIGDVLLGYLQREDAEWASSNYDRIVELDSFHIYGGDRDRAGNIRPLTVKVWATLQGSKEGPQFTDVDLPESEINSYFAKGDTVVYVSSTGKIHIGTCGTSIKGFTPMLYQDALDAGGSECANCFK